MHLTLFNNSDSSEIKPNSKSDFVNQVNLSNREEFSPMLNIIESKNVKNIKNQVMHKSFQELYELQLFSASHLSMTNDLDAHVTNIVDGIKQSSSLNKIGQNEVKSLFPIQETYKQSNFQKIFSNTYHKIEILNDENDEVNSDLTTNFQVRENFSQRKIHMSETEMFIRDFYSDSKQLLEEIRGQIPSSIVKIWLNGKVVWLNAETQDS